MKAKSIATNYDTVILIIQIIDKIENTWDVIGDYRVQDLLWENPILRVEKDLVKGFIAGDWRPSEYLQTMQYKALLSATYSKFMSVWDNSMNCNDILSSLSSPKKENYLSFQNPITSSLSLNFGEIDQTKKTIDIYNSNGSRVSSGEYHSNSVSIDMSTHLSGVYFVRIFAKEENYEPLRIVKQ